MGGIGGFVGGVAGSVIGTVIAPGLGTAIGGPAGTLVGTGAEALIRSSKPKTTTPGRQSYTRTRGGMQLSPVQVQSLAIIIDTFSRWRWPWPMGAARDALALAAVSNAYAESALKPDAVGDNGWSIGLFQANRKAGAGVGHSVENLKLPRYNTIIIIREAVEQRAVFESLLMLGTTPEDLTAAFSTYVERPKFKPEEEIRRRKICRDLFGDMATVRVQVPR